MENSKMRLFQVFMITALLIAGIPSLATAAVGAKSLRGLFSSDEYEVVPELWERGPLLALLTPFGRAAITNTGY
jgi:hypothetical protein